MAALREITLNLNPPLAFPNNVRGSCELPEMVPSIPPIVDPENPDPNGTRHRVTNMYVDLATLQLFIEYEP